MYSVLVAGGGLTGASLAVALADRGMRVAIVEAVPPQSPAQPSLDDRTSAIARTGVRILENLGVWSQLKEAPSPIHAVEISERGCFGGARIDAAAQGLDSLGSVVRNRVLGEALWDRLRAKKERGRPALVEGGTPSFPGLFHARRGRDALVPRV